MPGGPPANTVRQLREKVVRLGKRVDALDREVEELRRVSGWERGTTDVLVIEEMSKEEVRSRVLDVLAKKETTDIVELHETIRCDLGLLVEVIDELRKEGRLTEG